MRTALIRPALVLLAILALYFGAAAFILRFGLDRLLFPKTSAFAGPTAERVERITATTGAELLARQYGRADLGCVVFLPGQHGYLPAYDPSALTRAGLKVWLISYPGQEGAAGSATVTVVEDLVRRAVRMASNQCPQDRVVILGVSLGSALAVQSGIGNHPAGLVLVSAAPSLSAAIRTRLASRWYLMPLRLLPLPHVLKRDYTLSDALPSRGALAIFQGSADEQTPLDALRKSLDPSFEASIVRIDGGTHSTTFALSREAQLSTILRMLSQPESNPSLERP